MISNFDTLALSPVPVHPSSRSPTDEHWNQIRVRLFFFATTVTCLGRHQSMCPCFTPQLKSSGFSLTHWESLPLFVSLSLHLTLTLCRFFFFLVVVFCANPSCWFDSLFTSNVGAVCLFAEMCASHLISCETQRASITVTCLLDLSLTLTEPSAKPSLLGLTSMNFQLPQHINLPMRG